MGEEILIIHRELEAVTEQKDLGVLFQKDLKFSSHISQKINMANSMLAIIKRTFEYLDQEIFLRQYKALVRPHVEYANIVWYPHYRKDIESVESVQRRATKLLPITQTCPCNILQYFTAIKMIIFRCKIVIVFLFLLKTLIVGTL